MPYENDEDKTDEQSNPDLPENPLSIPKDVNQEQIPPARASISKRTIIYRLVLAVIILAVITGALFAAWKLIPSKNDNPAQSSENQAQTKTPEDQDPESDIGDSRLSETYTSDFLRIDFKHPQSWKITEENSGLIIKSPTFKLQENTGAESLSYFKIYIKRGATEGDGKYLGRGYAVADSEKIAYADPLPGQRKDSYLTNFGLETPDNFAYFIVQGNFNLMKGDTLGPKFASEADSFLISGGFSTDEQKEGLSTKIVSQDSYSGYPAYSTAVEIIKSLQLK
ncbi:MAG TPA: hypothetical protein VD947_01960 [Patescibacteria group bacterium]|nr:hypothetical protein [Patescibacteria group bacterium]